MTAEDILKNHNLKNTGCRKHIINKLLQSEVTLSENDIKNALPDLFDRVTFYRSLKTLEENNIIHKVVLQDSQIKYALNKTLLGKGNHPHFHCVKCDEVMCMESCEQAPVTLPSGFSLDSSQLLLQGTCPSCKIIKK